MVVIAVSAAVILGSGLLSSALKRRAAWPTGYTRKLFHFLIFFTAVGLHLWGGMPAVNILGIGMGIFVVLVVRTGEGSSFFEALAREKDFPRRGYFIVVPYLMTAAGGLLSNILFGSSAIMGYMICGAADAVAEPVGVRFGRHRYPVPSLRKVKISERSVEGSMAVFGVSLILGAFCLRVLFAVPFAPAILAAFGLAVLTALVEAISIHGADNLTIQVAVSGLTYFFIRLWG